MIYDLGIINGRIYLNGEWLQGNLYVKDGIISAVTNRKMNCKSEYDARNNWILPGFIDPHVHFQLDLGRYTSVDDFQIGTKCAALGGFTTVIDFLQPVKNNEDLNKAFGKRLREADNSCIDYSFHTTICGMEDSLEEFIEHSRLLGIPTIKLFTTYSSSDRRTTDETMYKLIELSKEKNILPIIHAENDELLQEKKILIKDHHEARPSISEISEVLKIAQFTEYSEGRAYIVHVSSGLTVQKLIQKYRDIINRNIFVESCPQYFYFSSDIYSTENGNLYTMSPPLRSEDERILLVNSIYNIDTIGTDHCSFMKEDKVHTYTEDLPMGVGGIETSFRALYSIYGEKIIDKFTVNPAKLHGLYPSKGTLNIGSQADIVVFDPDSVSQPETHYKSDYDIYGDTVLKGEVLSTILRGRFVVKDREFLGGKGSYIGRELI